MRFQTSSAIGAVGGLLLVLQPSLWKTADSQLIPETSLWNVQRATAVADEVSFQAEDGGFVDVVFSTDHAGFTGNGFADFGLATSSVAWIVDIPCTAIYNVTVRYASKNSRPVKLVLNGNDVAGGAFTIPETRSWTNWTTQTITVTLPGGDNQELKLLAATAPGPNVDMITFMGVTDCDDNFTDPRNNLNVKVVLAPNKNLMRNTFVSSLNGSFQAGLDSSGNLVVRAAATQKVLWSLSESVGQLNGLSLWMQDDGNLVMRDSAGKSIWKSNSFWNKKERAYLVVDNAGGLAVMLFLDDRRALWRGGIPRSGPMTPAPTNRPPSRTPTNRPPSPTPTNRPPSPTPTNRPPIMESVLPSTIVLGSNTNMGRNAFRSSPNGRYSVGIDASGNFIMRDDAKEVWRLRDESGTAVTSIDRVSMQTDGTLAMRNSAGRLSWGSGTSGNDGATMQIDDGGRVSVVFKGTPLWLDGIPRGKYVNGSPSSPDLVFPVRGAFYYAWYPQTWSIDGKKVFYRPNLTGLNQGFYKSGDPAVPTAHVKALEYAFFDLGIISWFGESTQLDRARITQMMEETRRLKSSLKWTVYYEAEEDFNFSVSRIVEDLNYLKKWFAWHPTFAHKDGKPVIFVWNEGDCDVAARWSAAAKQAGWYVVLKLFRKYNECPKFNEIDSWHQYGVTDSFIQNKPFSFNISPGFWRADEATPVVARPGKQKFCQWVALMNESGQPWQLVTSFNEWGEGTAVESAVEWQSASGYGQYLDCLRDPLK